VIKSFKCRETEKLYHREMSKKFPGSIQKVALRKLWILDAAENLEDVRSSPGNRLESLKGDRQGQYSIRINIQFRVCFIWGENNAYDVEIVDYH
jgi:toxin HigB-1